MNRKNRWLIYGIGKTGSLIAEEAVRRGHTPLLAGRSAERVKAFAERLGLEWAVADLSDDASIFNLLERVDLVVHTAGPFLSTGIPMIRASLKMRKHYLDISNEIPVFQAMYKLDQEARECGVAIIPGVGFGVAATDGLARYVASQITNPRELDIAIHVYSRGSSAGADITRLEVISRGGWARRGGNLIRVPFGSGGKRLILPSGEQTILPIPSGDLETAYRTTGIPNITAYSTFPVSPIPARFVLPILHGMVANEKLRRMLERRANHRAGPPIKREMNTSAHSYAWARARNAHGDIFEAWQEMGEGYDFTAESTVHAVEEVFSKQITGALTPTQAFGPDFVLHMNGVKRFTSAEGYTNA